MQLMQDPVARMVSAYRMHLKRVCYSRIRGEGLVRREDCPLLPINEWLEGRIEAARREPTTVYPVVDADVRCLALFCFCTLSFRSGEAPGHGVPCR